MIEYNDELSKRLGLTPFTTDANNNGDASLISKSKRAAGDKYSLRPRSLRKRQLDDDCDEIITIPTKISKSSRTPKPKQKAAPLSKYRRKTANARERTRMKEINQAFEALRMAVPQIAPSQPTNEKLTKITTLRLAMKYISTLSSALSSNQELPHHDFLSDCSELDSFLLESDGESLPLHSSDFSDHSLTPADFSIDFPDDSLTPVDFTPLSPDISEHLREFEQCDPFFSLAY